ncbi:hypothetical protein BBO99_00003149 [Phytophthora kernoviae]|uniref:Peptidase M14 domain-containing protein n=2 Tax=Phytophthora kernoviae TaxID=325452 RepID=A0A421GUW1_9STRA|nr:hypothetical protein G195_003426 [Phytophthora kernoviae 00238/432]KAG2528470.1 hypothetical protein JM16_002791 [Phytophthora kernoviae]KAG2530073.1 hypothetical protein JM18_002584 [Phytophthora kernoviae]RLM95367.1 hypothetical protein BBI17_003138 [Phytophthora kernoviae]RLN82119.1 hypothetical protein BBO99_00003149 [Phytophthora kernoviae]
MDTTDDRENEYLRFLRGMRPDDAATLSALAAAGTTAELDFRNSFVGPDGLPEIDHDGADFARMLLAQDDQDQKDTEAEEAVAAAQKEAEEAVAAARAEAEEAAAAVNDVLQLSSGNIGHRHGHHSDNVPGNEVPVTAKNRCRYYGKRRVRCTRAATGFDGRCGIHKFSQFCKHPKCSKFNQGNGFCIKHGGGKQCKEDGCEKQVQGYGYCSGHGGKPLCPIQGCDKKKMEGGYCKAHGGGRFCQHEGCKRRDIGGGHCISHGGGKKCKSKDCTKVDRGGGFCKRHGGGRKCEVVECKHWAIGGGICMEHKGPGKRCKTLACTKFDLGGGHCIAHGGGRKCIVEGCDKIRQVNKRCRAHGGKLVCIMDGCDRAAQNFKLCKTHGGSKQCLYEGCTNRQKGRGFCIRHGGGTKCKEEGCTAVDRGGGHCKAHGGGKKCTYSSCKKWVLGGGYCSDHLDMELASQPEQLSRITASYTYLNSEYLQVLLKMLLSRCCLLALGLLGLTSASKHIDPPYPAINYRSYAEMSRYLLELNSSFPDVVQVSIAQETFGLPYPKELQCQVDDDTHATEPCKQFVVHLTNHSTLANDPERPEVFISGALHGNERVGPAAAIELVALVAHATSVYATDSVRPTMDTQRWLRELVNKRNVLVTPMTNAYGYSHNAREELKVDPNRDYNYMRSGAECMQTMTSRVVNEIWRDHVFQLAVTFHGGTRAVSYEWGSPDHYLNGDSKRSEKSPDHMAQFQLGNTLANFAGVFPDGKLYPVGTMNDVVYGVTGGMEDWGYAASWENQFYDTPETQPFHPCEPTTFHGYPKEKTVYNNITHRAFNMLVETSLVKQPKAADLGNQKELYGDNVDFFRTQWTGDLVGHVPRNVRLALMMIEMVQPLLRWVDTASFSAPQDQSSLSAFPAANLYTTNSNSDQVTEMGCGTLAWERDEVATCNATKCSVTDAAHSKVQIAWEVLGALTVDSTHVQVSSTDTFEDENILIETTIQKGTTRRFYEFASDLSEAAAANVDTLGTSLFVTCLDLGNVTTDKLYVRAVATVDQDWKNQGSGDEAPSPHIPPQSHLVNARTNLGWAFEWNGHRVKAALEWTSPVIEVTHGNKVSSGVPASVTDLPLNTSTIMDESKDSDDIVEPQAGTGERTKSLPDDDDESEDSSEETSTLTPPLSSKGLTTTKATKTTDKDDDADDDDDDSEDSEDSEEDDKDDDENTTLDDELKATNDNQETAGTEAPSSMSTEQETTALAANGSNAQDTGASSSLVQVGYLIMSSCATVIVLTLAYLYRRVFRRARQPYINISSLEQPVRVTINSADDEEYAMDSDEDSEEGPRIPRHSRTSHTIL